MFSFIGQGQLSQIWRNTYICLLEKNFGKTQLFIQFTPISAINECKNLVIRQGSALSFKAFQENCVYDEGFSKGNLDYNTVR